MAASSAQRRGSLAAPVFRNLLVAIDGSAVAQRALQHAIELADALHARLTIVAVVPELPPFALAAGVDTTALRTAADDEVERRLREAVDRVPESVSVTSVLRHGSPAREILAVARAGQHDLLIMGSRGRGRLASNMLGSVAADVHFGTTLPMLVIHPDHDD
jgi:nucleotide-binding universal stress UspA family protein